MQQSPFHLPYELGLIPISQWRTRIWIDRLTIEINVTSVVNWEIIWDLFLVVSLVVLPDIPPEIHIAPSKHYHINIAS